jgi:hypothetical protein
MPVRRGRPQVHGALGRFHRPRPRGRLVVIDHWPLPLHRSLPPALTPWGAFAVSPSSTRRRIASEREASLAAAQRWTASTSAPRRRMPTNRSPLSVGGLPDLRAGGRVATRRRLRPQPGNRSEAWSRLTHILPPAAHSCPPPRSPSAPLPSQRPSCWLAREAAGISTEPPRWQLVRSALGLYVRLEQRRTVPVEGRGMPRTGAASA